MTSSGVLYFANGLNLTRRIRRQGWNRVSRRRAEQGGTNQPPAHDELDTAQHPNSKSKLGGSSLTPAELLSGIRSASDLRYSPSMRQIKSGCSFFLLSPDFIKNPSLRFKREPNFLEPLEWDRLLIFGIWFFILVRSASMAARWHTELL
jgi:hypothetical protein